MAFFNRVIPEPKLTARLFKEGFAEFGRVKRSPDTRTTEQLLENIEYYAKKHPEVAQFKNELKAMNPKHLGLVSDVCELANHQEMINTGINIKKPAQNGKSLFQFLIEILPKASKENPESVELSQAIVDNVDSIAAKYALGELSPLYGCKEAAPHMKAAIPLVGDVADAAFQGGYMMDYSRERNFVNGLKSFISPNVKLEKLEMLPQIINVAEKSKAMCEIEAFPFLTNSTPIGKIAENLETFKTIDHCLDGKTINLTEFLDKNVNMV